jgi:hypothetical protein
MFWYVVVAIVLWLIATSFQVDDANAETPFVWRIIGLAAFIFLLFVVCH